MSTDVSEYRISTALALAHDGVDPAATAVLTTLQEQPLYLVTALLTLFGLLGFVFLGVALWRSRMVPRAVACLLVAGVGTLFVPVPELLGAVLIAVALGWIGLTLAREANGPARPVEDVGSPAQVHG